ncbi:MAG: hypothetical protein LKF30_05780 [Sphingobium sp.]|jgi:hypothetical protein|nr:hypothetical protein [Sphingobium sp.]MCI1271303.1 hypothetical protein [Sphingobium sp.]MCI1757474.1 hypothetical protein [Sphingobium sp.]MCI2053142.1 hypothetical protein [Sphingobium sp.]
MTTPDELDALGLRAWKALAEEMKRQGPLAAWRDVLVRAPHALREMIEWLDGQPIERRRTLCEEAFGAVEEPRR